MNCCNRKNTIEYFIGDTITPKIKLVKKNPDDTLDGMTGVFILETKDRKRICVKTGIIEDGTFEVALDGNDNIPEGLLAFYVHIEEMNYTPGVGIFIAKWRPDNAA